MTNKTILCSQSLRITVEDLARKTGKSFDSIMSEYVVPSILDIVNRLETSVVDEEDAVRTMHRVCDCRARELIKGETCKKGCARCCYIRVSCIPCEGRYIKSAVERLGIAYDTERAARQLEIERLPDEERADAYLRLPEETRKCIFLADDNTCSIYEYRPMSCRDYFVASLPEYCDSNTNAYVKSIKHVDLDLIMSALLHYGKEDFLTLAHWFTD